MIDTLLWLDSSVTQAVLKELERRIEEIKTEAFTSPGFPIKEVNERYYFSLGEIKGLKYLQELIDSMKDAEVNND